MIIQAENIHKSFGALEVLKGVDLQVHKGEILSIVGASGAGKSTLLQILGTLSSADSGNLYIDGCDVSGLSRDALADFRCQHIGFVFQSHHLLPEFSAEENVMIPAMIAGVSSREARRNARDRAVSPVGQHLYGSGLAARERQKAPSKNRKPLHVRAPSPRDCSTIAIKISFISACGMCILWRILAGCPSTSSCP